MHFSFYVTSSLHLFCLSSGLLAFTQLGSINLIVPLRYNRPNFLYIHILFILTQLHLYIELQSLLMSALCNIIPYLYYSDPLYWSVSFLSPSVPVPN